MEVPNMVRLLPRFVYGAFVLLILAATSDSMLAQEMRDRELTPAYDFALVQSPIEITSIRLNGKDIQPREKIKGNDDWLRGVSFTLKNNSDKPVAYVEVGLKFPTADGIVVYSLNYGVDYSRGTARNASSPPPIQPGESFDLALTDDRYKSFLYILAQGKPTSVDVAGYFVMRVCFENEPDVIWEGGFLKRRDPQQFSTFKIIERYTLPVKPK
jgi:hypothetical protein